MNNEKETNNVDLMSNRVVVENGVAHHITVDTLGNTIIRSYGKRR